MKIVHRYPIFGSSVDEDKIALTVKGILIGLVPLIIGIAQYYDLPLSEAILIEIIQIVVTIIAAVVALYGLIRKLIVEFKK